MKAICVLTAYGRDKTKQAEMRYIYLGPSRKEKFDEIRTKGRVFNIKEKNS